MASKLASIGTYSTRTSPPVPVDAALGIPREIPRHPYSLPLMQMPSVPLQVEIDRVARRALSAPTYTIPPIMVSILKPTPQSPRLLLFIFDPDGAPIHPDTPHLPVSRPTPSVQSAGHLQVPYKRSVARPF